jgi:hypothetical protein
LEVRGGLLLVAHSHGELHKRARTLARCMLVPLEVLTLATDSLVSSFSCCTNRQLHGIDLILEVFRIGFQTDTGWPHLQWLIGTVR